MSPTTLEALLDATAGLLIEGGLAEATTAKVARRAGVAEGTIYRHFATKEAMVEAVFSRAWDRLAQDLEGRLPSRTDPLARLLAFLPMALAVFADHPGEAHLLSMEYIHMAMEKGACQAPGGSVRMVAILEETVRLAQAAGQVRPELDPWVAASLTFHGVSKTWTSRPQGADPAQVVAALQTLVKPLFLIP